MTKQQELAMRMLAVIAGASITTLNLVIGSTLVGSDREELAAYSQQLRAEFEQIAKELED